LDKLLDAAEFALQNTPRTQPNCCAQQHVVAKVLHIPQNLRFAFGTGGVKQVRRVHTAPHQKIVPIHLKLEVAAFAQPAATLVQTQSSSYSSNLRTTRVITPFGLGLSGSRSKARLK
jgi:hypothetical protein